jgi:hypothetical protein
MSVIFFLLVSQYIFSRPINIDNPIQSDSSVSIKTLLFLRANFFLTLAPPQVPGTINVTDNAFQFKPASTCYPKLLFLNAIFPCYNPIIKDIDISFTEIKSIRRRNALLIIPNRLVVKTKNGPNYMFYTWNRGKIVKAFKRLQNK